MSAILRGVIWFLPIIVVGFSLYLNFHLLPGRAAGRLAGATLIPALICCYGSDLLATLASLGIRWSAPATIPAPAFRFLGWVLIAASFIPALLL